MRKRCFTPEKSRKKAGKTRHFQPFSKISSYLPISVAFLLSIERCRCGEYCDRGKRLRMSCFSCIFKLIKHRFLISCGVFAFWYPVVFLQENQTIFVLVFATASLLKCRFNRFFCSLSIAVIFFIRVKHNFILSLTYVKFRFHWTYES